MLLNISKLVVFFQRTPIPQIKRLVEAVAYNTELESLSLANLGLYDNNLEVRISLLHCLGTEIAQSLAAVLELNTSLKKLNLETNYLSGMFSFVLKLSRPPSFRRVLRLFKAACVNQTLEEVKAVNQVWMSE